MRWSNEDKQAFADGQRLRAQTIHGRRFDGPEVEEWDEDLAYELRRDK